MCKYFSTYISGVSDVIKPALKKELASCEIELVLDGVIIYTSNDSFDKITSIRFLNNTFVLIRVFKNLSNEPFKPMHLWALRHSFNPKVKEYIKAKNIKSFRVINSYENKLSSPDKKLRVALESKIAKNYRLSVDRLSPDAEFWFLYRSEGWGLFGFRITNYSKVEHRAKGQLRPELANILCLLSDPEAGDLVLDPFAGHGTIVLERSYYPYKKIIAIEKSSELSSSIKSKSVEVVTGDFFDISIEKNSVTKIITDPPWGDYEATLDIYAFYKKIFGRFLEILTDNGLVVLLLARDIRSEITIETSGFKILSSFNILVSGKKASLFVLRKA